MTNKTMREKPNQKTKKEDINSNLKITFESVIPKSQGDRKRFVADCTFFYITVFKKQLEYFRGEQLLELAKIGRTEELNNIIRANINCFNLIDTFFEKMQNEHESNLTEIRDSFRQGDEVINSLKKKYN